MLARQRTSPYLPGMRSRLWRFVAASAGPGPGPGPGPQAPADAGADELGPAAAPVMALISRLPLDDVE